MAEQNATNSASSSIGEVQAVTGRVIAIGANGVERQLFAGDQIYPDDLIRTIGQGTIKVALKDGTSFDLGQGAEALLDEAVHSSNVEALRAAAVAEAAEIQRAIAEGGDPTEIADPTAAGGGGGGTGESIENAVGIERTGRVGVVEAGFETGGLERGIEPVPVDPVYFGIGSDGAPAGGTEPAAPAPLPTLALTVSAPDDSNDNTPTITGTTDAGAGSTVSLTVTDSAGNVQNLTTTVQGDGSYSVEVPDALADGGYTVDASVTDTAGNTANASDPGRVDTTAPVITVSAPDNTGDNTPTITGTTDADAGSTVSLTVTDSAGDVQNLTTTVQGDGSYSVEVPVALADGGYTVDASVTDMAGNTANASDPGSVVISNGINEVPVANADVDTTSENASITINVLSNDTDLDTSDTLMVAAVDVIGTKGSVINNGTDVRYDPGAAYDYLDVGESATDTFNYTISDGHGGTDTATVTVNITGSEDVSTITSATANLTETDAVLST
ncbi:MAG: retention module-containing protein, partial [Sedimenticolaceae bacterium]